jgi:hypothetical protein
MTSESDFRNAVITDPLGNTTPLVTEDKKSSLAAAAAGMAALRNSAVGLMPGCDNPIMKFENGVVMTIVGKAISILPSSVTENPFTRFAAQVVNDITAGFKWVIDKVKSLYDKTVGKAVTLIVQKTKKVWKFFVQVGGKVIHMVIDCVEKVAAGIKYILEIIGIPVDKIVAFFKKALGLDTAARINTALKNMADWSLDSLIEQISELKETSVGFLSDAIEKIEKMADIDADSLSEIKLTDTTSTGSNVLSAMGISLDSHSMYLYDLIKQAITEEIGLPDISLSGDMETAAGTLLNDIREIEENVERIPASLIYIAEEIEGLVQDFSASALLSVLKKILSVVADDFLHISKTLLKTIFDVVIEGLRAVWKALNTPLQIPFLSDILSAFGIHEFTMIDMVTYPLAFLVGALNSTAKLVSGQEFIDVDALEEFAKADNLKELKQIGGVSYE